MQKTELASYSNIWKISYPIIAGSIAQNLVNVVDTAFMGRLGAISLGAAGNSIIFYFIFIVLGMGFAIGAEIIVGRRNGEKKFTDVGKVVDHCFYILIPLSIALFFILKYCSHSILGAFTMNQEILTKSFEYLDIRIYGIFFAFINLAFRSFYVGTIQTSILTWSTGLMAVINVLFDYLLIFGHFGFPEMGIKGAALASVISEIVTTLFFIIYTFNKIDLKKYELLVLKKWDTELAKRIINVSSPIMIQHFAAITSWMIFFLVIEKIGSTELAVSHIIRSIYMVLMIPLFGFAAATNTLVSNFIGMDLRSDVLYLVKKIALLSLGITALIIPFNLLIPDLMVSIFTTDPLMIKKSIPVIYVITGSMLVFSLSTIIFSAVSGTGNTAISLFIELGTILIYLSFAYWIGVVQKVSLPLVWCSEFVYFGLIGILSFLYLKYGAWDKKII